MVVASSAEAPVKRRGARGFFESVVMTRHQAKGGEEESLEVATVHPAVALERLPVSELPLREQDGIATRAAQRSQRREASETTTNHDSIEVQIHGYGKGRQRVTATAGHSSHAHAA